VLTAEEFSIPPTRHEQPQREMDTIGIRQLLVSANVVMLTVEPSNPPGEETTYDRDDYRWWAGAGISA
jgi:hypothetical protein